MELNGFDIVLYYWNIFGDLVVEVAARLFRVDDVGKLLL